MNAFYERVFFQKGQSINFFAIVLPEYGSKIAAHRPAPRSDVCFLNILSKLLTQKNFQQLQYRSMIEHLRINIATTAPGRSNYQWYPVAKADRAGHILLLRYMVWSFINTAGGHSGFGLIIFRCNKRWYVIIITII